MELVVGTGIPTAQDLPPFKPTTATPLTEVPASITAIILHLLRMTVVVMTEEDAEG